MTNMSTAAKLDLAESRHLMKYGYYPSWTAVLNQAISDGATYKQQAELLHRWYGVGMAPNTAKALAADLAVPA